TAWLTVAMASTLGGNFTVLGSIANLIVVQRAAASGVEIGFWDYFRVGAPLTLLTLLIGTLWLWLRDQPRARVSTHCRWTPSTAWWRLSATSSARQSRL